MGLLNIFSKKEIGPDAAIAKQMHSFAFKNSISELMEDNFNVMFLPLFHIFEDGFFLKYPYPNYVQNKTLYKEEITSTQFNTEFYLRCIKEGKIVVFEIQNKGSLIFTNHLVSDVFAILQRHYANVKSYVFMGNDTGGYFKILENGKIVRKISSYLIMDNIKNCPETRGLPCEYELEKNKRYKVDPKAKKLKDMLPNFKKENVLDLFDYYVGKDCLDNNKIKEITIFYIA